MIGKPSARLIHSGMAILLIFGTLLPALPPQTSRPPHAAQSSSPGNSIAALHPQAVLPPAQSSSSSASQNPLQSVFTNDVAQGDGSHVLTVSTSPLNYQASDGSWQPIDPRFTAVEGGFANFTNALSVSTGEKVATLNLRRADVLVQWQPLDLRLGGNDQTSVKLAGVLDPTAAASAELTSDRQTVRYTGSWSVSGLVEEVTAGPGSVEQKLVVQSALHPSQPAVDTADLAFSASLRLPPGVTLYANGAVQTGTFSTSGGVEIRSGRETAFGLNPVIAYEQANSSANVRGEYRLTPTGEGLWNVEVVTPWSWWAAADRQYPVVLDPTMKILSPVTTAQMCDDYTSSPCPATGYIDPNDGSEALFIGHETSWGIIEALFRFDNLPTLPPGYVVQKADLLIAPLGFVLGTGGKVYTKQARLVQVTSAWDPATVTYLSNRPTTAYPPLDTKSFYFGAKPAIPIAATTFVTTFHLQSGPTGMVTDWLTGAQANNGFLLYQYPDNNCLGCSDTLRFYTAPLLWTKADIQHLDPENPYHLSSSTTSGIMLQIIYTPPTLALNQPVYTSLPTFGDNFADTYHTYLPPSSNSTWTAIAVKGLNQVQMADGTIDEAAGNLRMARGCVNQYAAGCVIEKSEGDFNKRPNFILARGDPAATDMAAWIYPPNPATPANASLDEYEVDAVPSSNLSGNPTLTPGTQITRTVVMSTSEIMQLYNLNLVGNTRIGVQVHASTIDPATGFSFDMPYIEARLFKPAMPGTTLVKDLDGLYIGGHTSQGSYELGKAKVGTNEGGTWALSLENFGNVDPTLGEPPITYTNPLTMSIQMNIIVCNSDSVPTLEGCFKDTKPSISTKFMDVGNFRVYNEAGFTCGETGTSCSTNIQPGPGATLPAIVWRADWLGGQQDYWVTVAGSQIAFDTSTTPMYFIYFGNTWLSHNSGAGLDMLELFSGVTVGHPDVYDPNDPNYARLVPLATAVYASPPLSASDAAHLQINVNVKNESAEASTQVERQVQVSPGTLTPFTFNLSWVVQAEGYANFYKNLTAVSIPPSAQVASLSLVFGSAWDMDYTDTFMPNGRFTNLRGAPGFWGDGGVGARIAAPASLGSNWKGVTPLLLPVGTSLEDSDAACPGDCLDVRAFNDTPSAPNRTWDLPDLNISGQAQTLLLNKPGELTVFSTDHPNATNSVGVPFSFRTFQGQVNVDVKACPGSSSTEKVVVITGQSKIALPGLGSDSDPATMIGANFILCETTLRDVSLEFQGPPDIPAGSTGILVSYVKGEVLIGPNNTQIDINLKYHDNSNIVNGSAKVSINTEGLFDMQTSGEVLAKVEYNGHAWVAWNPLDVGLDMHAVYSSWLSGDVYAHMWKGQGWQNKYSWLANDNATHLAGSIAADIGIDKGQAFSWALLDIPPWDITFEITVAFGQFCTGSGCSSNEWGIKGKFSIIGFDVGFFYGFSSGFHFILGSDGHALIDQYGTAQTFDMLNDSKSQGPMSAGKPLYLTRQVVADPLAPLVTQPLNVTAFTGSFVAGLTWSQGAPLLTLVRPDGVEINPTNAASHGVSMISGALMIQYGVTAPMQGTWQAKITNTAADNDYHLVWFANKAIPNVENLSPAGDIYVPGNDVIYPVQWSVPAELPSNVDLRLSLYYTVTNSVALTTTQVVGGVIRENLPLADGSYPWDLSSLAKGDYHVYARVYNGQPGNDPIQPAPTITGTDQIPGDLWIHALGVIHLQDDVPPAIPTGFGLVPVTNGFLGCWSHNTEKDLSGYVVRYNSPDVNGVFHDHDLRLNAEVSEPNSWQQCARLGGFNNGELVSAKIAAYDASGNLSAFSDLVDGVVSFSDPDGAPDPGRLSVAVVATNQVVLTWGVAPVAGGGAYVSMSWGRPLGVGRILAPMDVGAVNTYTFTDLVPGWVYFFQVQNRDDWARLSQPSNPVAALVSDFRDRNGNGLPDDWEAAYGVTDPTQDGDGDGLDALAEYQNRTDPRYPDTDGDGFSDGTEVAGGSDPLDPNSTPATLENYTSGLLPLPDLSISPTHLAFYAFTQGLNPAYQTVSIVNIGGGTLEPVVSDNAAWLTTALRGTSLAVLVEKTGLAAGHYTAQVAIAGAPGSMTQNSPQTVSVDLWLLQGKPPASKFFLPVVNR